MAWAGSRGVNTTAAGYGNSHQKLRKALLAKAYGQPCSRCGLPMLPGQALHLDHDDYDGTKWRGFSHAKCICGPLRGKHGLFSWGGGAVVYARRLMRIDGDRIRLARVPFFLGRI